MPPGTGTEARNALNWSAPTKAYRITHSAWVAVDVCQLLFPMAKYADCYRNLQHDWPTPPKDTVYRRLDAWWKHFRFKQHQNMVLMCVDSRRNDLKRRYVSPEATRKLAAAKQVLAKARSAQPDDQHHQNFSASDWLAERKAVDLAQRVVAAYDHVLVALLKQWIRDNGFVSFVLSATKSKTDLPLPTKQPALTPPRRVIRTNFCCHCFRHNNCAQLVCAPFEADAQLVSLQRQGLADFLLSEDSDIAHLGAKPGTVLSGYIRWKEQRRHAFFQPQTDALRRCLRASLLGTDYMRNMALVRDWGAVDEAAKKLYAELDNKELYELQGCQSLKDMAAARVASRRAATQITANELVRMFVDSVLMFEHGPVSKLCFSADDVTETERRAAFRAGNYTACIKPLHPFPHTAHRGLEWFRTYFQLAGDETPYFKGELWSRTDKVLDVPSYTLANYLECHGTGQDRLPPGADRSQILPYSAFLPYIPQLCSDSQLKAWCTTHLITMRSATERHIMHHPNGASEKGFEDAVRDALSTPVQCRNLPLSRAFVQAHGLADPEPFTDAGTRVATSDILSVICGLNITDELIQRSLSRLQLSVANDQRRKAVRYVKGGHMDLETLHLTRVKSATGDNLLCHVSVVASR